MTRREILEIIGEYNKTWSFHKSEYLIKPSETIANGTGAAFELKPVNKLIKLSEVAPEDSFEYVSRIQIPENIEDDLFEEFKRKTKIQKQRKKVSKIRKPRDRIIKAKR